MRRATLAALTLAGAAGIHSAPAQEVELESPQGRVVTARVSQSANVDSNYDLDDPSPGTSYYGDTRFGLGFANETPTQDLALGLDTGLRALWRAEEDFEFVVASPSLGFVTYAQEGVDTGFDAEFRVRTRQVDASGQDELGFDPDDPDDVPDNLDQGAQDTREVRYDANLGLVLGRTSPSTYELRLDGTAFDYTDEAGTSLVPRQQVEGSALWTLRLTPVFSAALFGSYLYYTAEDDADTELNVAEGEAGLVYQPDETLRIRGGLGWADRHRDATNRGGVRQTIQDDAGITARADISWQLPSFSLIGNARWTAAAPESRLSGGMTAIYRLPRGQVIGRVFQNYVGGRGGDEERVTGASLGLVREINSVSRVGLDFAYATQENQDDPAQADIDRTDVTVSYGYDITDAIDAEVGYRFRNRIEDPQDADSHRVFFVLGRDFVTGL